MRLTTYEPVEGGIPYVTVKDEQDALQKLAAYEDAEEHAKHPWIPVTERLPDTCAPVLVCLHWGLDNDEITVGEYWGNSKASPGWGTFDPFVTHWMPRPKPPKEET